jgi:hypothetical protein
VLLFQGASLRAHGRSIIVTVRAHVSVCYVSVFGAPQSVFVKFLFWGRFLCLHPCIPLI